jgi:hypothetical protein
LDTRRLIAPVLAVVLLAAVAAGVWYSNSRLRDESVATEAAKIERDNKVILRGLIGSEKETFFADARVQKALALQGITVSVEKAGSRAIAGRYDATKFDFGFPSGAPAAQQLRSLSKASNVFTPFYTPIVFASWRPIAEILVANGMAAKQGDFYFIVDMPGLMAAVEKGTRWKELKSSSAFPTSKSLLVNSTDVRTSNSAAMFLSLASYIALPPAFRTTHVLKDGKTARQLLDEQLALLDDKLREVVANVAASDANALIANGQFLEMKFNQPDFLER